MHDRSSPPGAHPRQKLVQLVYDAIFADVAEGRLQAGSRLIQDELAAAYGVSRQPVQQALLLLRNDGIVCDAVRRGFLVTALDVDQVRNLYQVRGELEGFATRLAALRGAAAARHAGPAVMEDARQALESGSLMRLIDADIRFHSFICEISGNPIIGEMLQPLYNHIRRIMAEVMRDDASMPETVWNQHAAILAAVEAGDAKTAERIAREHLVHASAKFIDRLQQRQADANTKELARRVRR